MRIADKQWDTLAGMLRREIEGYGRLFRLLDDQRAQFIKDDIDELQSVNATMADHTTALQNLRSERETLVRGIWEQAGDKKAPSTVKGLIAHSPEESGPLFEELLVEVNRLVDQTRHRLMQNQMLLRRKREIGRKFLDLINPGSATSPIVYARNGTSRQSAARQSLVHYEKRA